MSGHTRLASNRGATFSEVMVAMAILPLGLLGTLGAFHVADTSIAKGSLSSRALNLVQSRIEAKRACQWNLLLTDDLDLDGVPDIAMRDDGQAGDPLPDDGIYSASHESEGVLLKWTVAPSRFHRLADSGSVVIEAEASYLNGQGELRHVKVATLRANPLFVGP